MSESVDVLIVGAGLSGIDAAYRVQTTLPGKSYAVLEARETLGGTWDLFRYPGIRSDSDMFTLGFPFRPWRDPKSLADGPSILAYIRETAEAYGIDRKIRYRRKVVAARWSTDEARWTVEVQNGETGALERWKARFLFVCAGYYDYDEGYTPELPGRERFKGRVVHPQKWTDDVAWEGKRVVVIGSGATAVTLVPALAARAAHVTMLQRSPTYILSVPGRDKVADALRARLPPNLAHAAMRWKNVLLGMGIYSVSRRFPKQARRLIVGQIEKRLGSKVDVAKHFSPRYDPWDQRLCLVPDADLFDAIEQGRASVVTDEVETFTERGLKLRSGAELEADLVVTATGLKLKLFGGMDLEVDGQRVRTRDTMIYKGMMCSGVPNLAFTVGYTNASWTLKSDLVARYVCRLIRELDAGGHAWCRPRRPEPSVHEEPLIDFSSGYIQRASEWLPRQGSERPWKLHQNYVVDLLALGRGPVRDRVLEFG